MVSLRTVPSIFSVFDTSIRRVDYALWAARWFHDSDKSYFARSLPISSLLFLRNWTNRATLKKLNLMTSEPRERIFEPRKRRIETRFPRVVWLLDMNQPTIEPPFLIWGAIYELATRKPLSNHEFQNATDRTCRWFDTSNQYCIINSEETPVKAVMNKLIERVCTNYHEEAKTDSVAIHEVNRPSARSHLKSQFRQKHRDHEPSRVRVHRLVGLLSKRKSREHSKNIMKNCFPKSSKIHSISKNYKDFRWIESVRKNHKYLPYSEEILIPSTSWKNLTRCNRLCDCTTASDGRCSKPGETQNTRPPGVLNKV